MKKIFALLVAITLIFALFSCTTDNSDGNGATQNVNQNGVNQNSTAPQIVINEEIDSDMWTKLYNAIFYEFEAAPRLADDSYPQADMEIVIGNTNRDISTKAYRALGRVTKEEDSHVSYVVYADGGSIALAYEEDKYGLNAALLMDVNYFVDTMVTDYKEGKIKSDYALLCECFDMLRDEKFI